MALNEELAQEWLGDDYEAFDGENGYEDDGDEDYDDEFGAGVTIIEAEPAEPEPETDLADDAYADPLALVNAWEGALQDYKASTATAQRERKEKRLLTSEAPRLAQQAYPEQFLPPAEPPRTLVQNQLKAPFWYGPPPSEASTSKLPAAMSITVERSSIIAPRPQQQLDVEAIVQEEYDVEQLVDETMHPNEEEKDDGGQQRKRKRLTGSQKKARKAARLGLRPMPKRSPVERDGSEPMLESSPPPATEAVPAAAHRSGTVGLKHVSPPPTTTTAVRSQDAVAPNSSSSLAQNDPTVLSRPPNLPSPGSFRFVVPPMSSLPRQFPAPPGITPLSGNEPPLDPETPEQLLESALWSWYSAGYQTALYHAAVGVAKFAPSAEPADP